MRLSLALCLVLLSSFLALPLQAATFTVTNTNDSGAGSLRQAIDDANGAVGDDEIEFDSGIDGQTINLLSSLSALASGDVLTLITNGFTNNVTVSGGSLVNNAAGFVFAGKINIGVPLSGNGLTIGRVGGFLSTDEAGPVFMNGTNTYTGLTSISNATAVITSDAALGNGTTISLANGTLQLDGDVTSAKDVVLQPIAGIANGTIEVNGSSNSTFSGVISIGSGGSSGGVTFNKTGSGQLTLSGNNTYSGTTNITGGTLRYASANALGTSNIAMDGGRLAAGGTFAMAQNISLGSGGGTFHQPAGGPHIFSGVISGTGAFTKNGVAEMVLTGSNTFSGTLNIEEGTLTAASESNIGTGNINFNSSSSSNYGTLKTDGAFNTSKNIAVTNGAIDANGFDNTFSGVISGSGTLVFDNGSAETTTLTGTNTISGQIIQKGGTLVLGNSAAAGTATLRFQTAASTLETGADLSLSNDMLLEIATTFDTDTHDSTFSGAIGGTGSLTKEGTGMLILNGINNYSGPTTVNDGTLQIGDEDNTDASISSNVTVANGATLSGHGSVFGNLVSSGTVRPGGSVGTLTVSGDYTQNANGTLAITISPGTASLLSVMGNAIVNGTIAIGFETGTYAPGSYTFLTAASITGENTVLVEEIPASTTELEALIIKGTTAYTLIINDPNAGPANASGITVSGSNSIASSHNAANTLFSQLGNAGGGNGTPSANLHLRDDFAAATELKENVKGLAGLVESMPDVLKGMGGWFKAQGNLASVGSEGANPGYNNESAGFMFGMDKRIAKDMIFGAAGGYEHTDFTVRSGAANSGDTNTVRFALYGRKELGDSINIDAQAGYALHMIEAERFVALNGTTARAEHNGHEFSVGGQASRAMQLGGATLTPRAGLNFVHFSEEAYTETGAGAFNVTVNDKDTESLRLFTGMEATLPLNPSEGFHITPLTRITYSYDAIDDGRNAQVNLRGTNFTVQGIQPSRHTLSLGTGFTTKLDERLDAFGSYDVNLRTGNSFDQTFAAGLKLQF